MIYVDSNVPMYLVGGQHVNKQRVVELVAQLLGARDELVTSAETFQEIIHRYVALRDRLHLGAAYEALETMVVSVADVTKQDADGARALSGEYPQLSSRDCLHVAVMRRLGCTKVWSYDAGFDAVPSLQRIL
ncbi:MAG TPA: type II toxin-antitoxin system VapC family toxin [Candidatus Limnocylindria bacterium]|nr:type II toxin-antitoxin system VapC family toxin [Candidatus Limnocylindria bacterium]